MISKLGAMIAAGMLAAAARPAIAGAQLGDTVMAPSGLRYAIARHGSGPRPQPGQLALIYYTGRLRDGTMFDDSRLRPQPFAFRLGTNMVIRGMDIGVALLHVGDRATFIIPPALAYGNRGSGAAIPPNATLVFDIELMGVRDHSLGELIADTIAAKGPAAAEAMAKQLGPDLEKDYFVSEDELVSLGYDYLGRNKLEPALAVFRITLGRYPKSYNAYDGLGDSYMKAGNSEQAIAGFRKSLGIDRADAHAEEMLRKLGVTP